MIDLLPKDSSIFSTNPSGSNSILSFIIEAVLFCFDWLDSIGIMGVSLLDFFVTVFLIGTFIPIIFTIVRGYYIRTQRERRADRKYNERRINAIKEEWDID